MSAEARLASHRGAHFERLDAVLADITEYIAAIGAVLDSLDNAPMTPHAALLAPTLALAERHLLGALERYLDDAQPGVLATFVPYRMALPLVEVPPGTAALLDAPNLIRWLLALHQPLEGLCQELAAEAREASVREALDGLASQMESHGRALSKTFLRLEDL